MARIDRAARWIAADVLRELGVEQTPASMGAMMPLCYGLAEGALRGFAEGAAYVAADLKRSAADRLPVPAGVPLAEADLAEWEAELSRDDPETDGGGL